MKGAIIQVAMLVGLMSAVASASGATGGQMLSRCEMAVKLAAIPPKEVTLAMAGDANYCMGAVEATASMLALHRDMAPIDRAVCMPEISLSQMARVAVKYMKSRPEIAHLGSGTVLYAAFLDAFPCDQKS